MRRNIQIKPSKATGTCQLIMGGIFTMIGLTFVIPKISESGGPVWFGVLWTGIAFIGTITGAINAFSDTGIPTEEIVSHEHQTRTSTASRLRELDGMLRDQMISKREYTDTRRKILDAH